MNPTPDRITRYHVVLFVICFFGTVFGGVASTLMSVYLPVAVRDLLGEQSETQLNNTSAYINSVFIFGGAVGGFLCGWISDKFGRKTAVIISIASIGIFMLCTAFMENWWLIVACRFLTGFGVGGILVTATTIIVEDWPTKTRAIFVGFLSVAIPVGIFSAGAIDYFVSSWREAFYLGIIPIAIAALSIKILNESSVWLNSTTDRQQNKNISVRFSSGYSSTLLNGSVIFGTMLIGLWAIFSWLPTWIHTLVLSGDGHEERGLSMMMLGIGGLAGGFLSGWLMNAIGIRRSLILCFVVCAVMSLVLFKTNAVFATIILVEIAILAFFFGLSQGILSVYIPDLFPVSIRGTATGFCFNTGRLLTGTAVLFVGVLVTQLGGYGNALLIFSSVFVIGLIVTIFTKQKSSTDEQDVQN
ncbi:MAG: MFS transporter [Chitinophagaceae bacterium]|nr:MFS transporter [Chitinophagaceae bacterium]